MSSNFFCSLSTMNTFLRPSSSPILQKNLINWNRKKSQYYFFKNFFRIKSNISTLPIVNDSVDPKLLLEVVDVLFDIEILSPDECHQTEIVRSFHRIRVFQQIFRIEVDTLKCYNFQLINLSYIYKKKEKKLKKLKNFRTYTKFELNFPNIPNSPTSPPQRRNWRRSGLLRFADPGMGCTSECRPRTRTTRDICFVSLLS